MMERISVEQLVNINLIMSFNIHKCYSSTFSCLRFQSYLFQYPQKKNINIHGSILINSNALFFFRLTVFLILTFRYGVEMYVLYSVFNIVQYFTSFGYLFTWLYFTMAMQDYFFAKFFKRIQKQIGKFRDWVSLIYQVAICSQIPVTVLFWLVLYDYSTQLEAVSFLKQVGVHGFPLFCLLIDYCFNIYQFPRKHLLVVLIAGTLYLLINISFSLAVQPVYAPLDWVSFTCYIYVAGCYILVAVMHLAFSQIWSKFKMSKINPKDIKDCKIYEQFNDQIGQSNTDSFKI